MNHKSFLTRIHRDQGGAVVTHLPPASEVSNSNPGPYVGKLGVAYQWSTIYSTEPLQTVCTGFLCPQNYSSGYDLYSVDGNVKNK